MIVNKYQKGGGSGSGSTVTWQQTVTGGTKIARISIDGSGQDVFCPEGGSGSEVSYSQTLSAGTEIGQITIDGSATTIYAPEGGSSEISLEYNKIREIEHNDYVSYTFTHSGETWGSDFANLIQISNNGNSFNFGVPQSSNVETVSLGNFGWAYGNSQIYTRPMLRGIGARNYYSQFPELYFKVEVENDNVTWVFAAPSSYTVTVLSLEDYPGFEYAGSASESFTEIAPAGAILLDSNFSSQSFAIPFHHYICTHRFEEEFAIYAENTWAMQPDQYIEDEGIWQALSFGAGGYGQDIYLTFFSRGGKYMVGWTNNQFHHFGKQAVYDLPTASSSSLGGVKVGNGLSIDSNGVLSAKVSALSQSDYDALVQAGTVDANTLYIII